MRRWCWVLLLLLVMGCGGKTPSAEHAGASHDFSEPERFVERWNDPARDGWQKPDEIVKALSLSEGDVVVDLGAGTGYLTSFLSKAVPKGHVIALDVEPAMVRYLTDAIGAAGWENVEAKLGRVDGPDLQARSVDRVVMLNVWHHVQGRDAYAKALVEALSPGGILLVVDFLPEETEGFGPPLSMRLPASEVAQVMAEAGLEVEVVPEGMPRHYMVRGTRPSP